MKDFWFVFFNNFLPLFAMCFLAFIGQTTLAGWCLVLAFLCYSVPKIISNKETKVIEKDIECIKTMLKDFLKDKTE